MTLVELYEKYEHLLSDAAWLPDTFIGHILRECWTVIKTEQQTEPEIIRQFVARVNARAEADMLAGNSLTGAHHRAIEAELEKLT